ncbi:pyridoxamine 5'-phosphate oxidase [Wenjunlia vitaminophila]|uniref:Pyridoxamine 5'-phosphate oxidase n=1 Tax=Wenjunlia vitaminophila TaxID=76728 RepID=A0A0T6LU99_WENVI|nr:TIGR03618 family F420-dependent PPOX class oxidoreductase [Wenjunlia vitaminophila]KRV49574.1 pyridoxamine 5'-phosphate oxidase [Wenjunlia vitaminophila]
MSLSKEGTGAPALAPSVEEFLTEPHIATLTTFRPDGSPHVVAVRFTWDPAAGLARVMTVVSSRKARNLLAAPGSRAALCQVAGFKWVTLEGTGTVSDDPRRVAEGVRRYAKRYYSPPPNPPGRVVVEIAVDRVMSLNA